MSVLLRAMQVNNQRKSAQVLEGVVWTMEHCIVWGWGKSGEQAGDYHPLHQSTQHFLTLYAYITLIIIKLNGK